MNKKQLIQLGVPEDCIPQAISCVQAAAKAEKSKRIKPKKTDSDANCCSRRLCQ